MRKLLTAIVCILCPSSVAIFFLNCLGHRISKNSHIGFSIILVDKIYMATGSSIGHFNFIRVAKMLLRDRASILKFNFIDGPFKLKMKTKSSIGNRNVIKRAKLGVTYGQAFLSLGELTKITAGHKLDLTKSIEIGDYSIIAGEGTQIWTHGYYHAKTGPQRFRIDGGVYIGNNVYIGSRCVFNLGVKVADAAIVGSNSSISKSLEESCLYVSQPLRMIRIDRDKLKSKLIPVRAEGLVEEIYEKAFKSI